MSNIRIHPPDCCHSWGIEFNYKEEHRKDDAMEFISCCNRLLVIPKYPGNGTWFHQCGSQEPVGYQFFEYWGEEAEMVVLKAAALVAEDLSCEIDLNIGPAQDEFSYKDAERDILQYLVVQPEEYFAERGTTRAAVMTDEELIGCLADEHHKCVCSFGNDRAWSSKDACDTAPGIGHIPPNQTTRVKIQSGEVTRTILEPLYRIG